MPRSKPQDADKVTRYDKYEAEWRRKDRQELLAEYEHQSSVISGSVVGSGIATLAIPLTMGLSVVALGGTGPAIYIARKKRAIVQKILDEPETSVRNHVPKPRGTQQVPVEVNDFAISSHQLPVYTPRASRPSLSLLRGSSRRGEKEVYVPQPQVEGPPAYSESVASSREEGESRPHVHFAPPVGPPPGRSTLPSTSNPFADGQEIDSSITGHSVSATHNTNDGQSRSSHVNRSDTVASSYDARGERPAVSLIDSPISPVSPHSSHAPQQPNVNINQASTEDIAKRDQGNISRYDSIAGANPFLSRVDIVAAHGRS